MPSRVHTELNVGGKEHELNNRAGSFELIMSSPTPTSLDSHSDPEVRAAYAVFLQEIAAATSPTGKKRAANRNIAIIVQKSFCTVPKRDF